MSKGSWLFGFACGIAAGWLFAPEKGSDLRKKIFAARSSGKSGINPIKRDVVEALREVAESTKHIVNDEIELVKKLMKSSGQKTVAHSSTAGDAKSYKVKTSSSKTSTIKRKSSVRKPRAKQEKAE